MAKKVILKERDTNETMYPATDLASVIINSSTNLSLLTQGRNGEVLTSENNIPVWKSVEKTELPENLVTTDTDLTIEGIKTFNKVVIKDGTSSLFLKGDGSLDSNTYLTEHLDISGLATKDELGSTNTALSNLEGRIDSIVSTGGEPNTINNIKVNDVIQPITDKTVNLTVPTTVSLLTDSENYLTKDNLDWYEG